MEFIGVLIAFSYGLVIGFYWGKAKAHTSIVNTNYCSFEDAKFVKVESPSTALHDCRVTMVTDKIVYKTEGAE
jgi:hypothetical protein